MLLSKSRYSLNQLKSLGYCTTYCNNQVDLRTEDSRSKIQQIVFGQFKNVIDVIFSSSDGSLDFSPSSLITENTPDSVRLFLQNFLFQNVTPARSAPDDASALDMLIPRSVQTSSELVPYLNKIRSYVYDGLHRSETPVES
ncbi:hypothetical protein [Sigmofec virus UA08Rod_4124]|uniref:Uncharacterized protein n=1 Tax=Sigmofec virus UA08Rod_4124 TaxID=2929395 RepID=A0A976R7I1_9VIRU|nr:hypothetical protein [Sigmofec virus UA08Rod_4124]